MNDLPPGALHPVTVITGASAGLGAELAKVFASHGHALVLVARREAELQALADTLAALPAQARRPRALVVAMDLARPDAADRLAATLTQAGVEPAYVVNNAGFGLVGAAAALPRDGQRAMVDLNIGTLTDLSLAFLDSLRRHRGGILNVASLAGFLPGPGMAVYYATKAYVVSFSEA
ncbi:MAG TPA: SDR family NAD(P)-dependent oxidoreductase, partial [Xanthobacteraceae bacterium]|nr:SDR family NAD(P)-dependent oxidoreductase [Xanthobacteraceae bacterium]